jgi:meso-butanediol dehydrogenase/(S,S)-butanediol dehydrogenase/diacetyl reductase
MDLDLKNKVAIVTGGALGLGRAIAMELIREGAKLAIVDINQQQAEKVAAEIGAAGNTALSIKTDVTKGSQVKTMVDTVIKELGRIDILMNNAGIVGPQVPWAELSEQSFDEVFEVNFKGMFLCAKAVLPQMMKQKSGKIVMTASCAAKTAEQFNGVYSATKAAVQSMTQSLAREVGRYNINVNSICPAAMDTNLMERVYRERSEWFDITPEELKQRIKSSFFLPRDLTVEDTAHLAVFLASDKAGMMTGQGVNITGGIEVH